MSTKVFTTIGGVLLTLFFAFTILARDHSAGQGETFHDGKDLKSKTSWDHDVLKVTTTQSHIVTLESYCLAADGSMTDSVVQPGHKPIVLVFHRN